MLVNFIFSMKGEYKIVCFIDVMFLNYVNMVVYLNNCTINKEDL